MKVELVANLAANGELILLAQANAYEAPEEISGMGHIKALECGNVVMGLTTYQLFAQPLKDILAQLEVVVLNPEEVEGDVYTAKSAMEAAAYLSGKGFETACVIGGAMTFNSFLEAGLADDLYFNLFPVVIGGGGVLETVSGNVLDYKLVDAKANGDVAMLHFTRRNG
ncbi:MAG: dihydrofolate reductase family protein [Clostridiales bacterium]|nr:dihydrofolate reductase family protein [Clostridiales bacterium]